MAYHPPSTEGTKVCRICHLEQPIDCFNAAPDTRDGRNHMCRTCLKAANHMYHLAAIERRHKKNKEQGYSPGYNLTIDQYCQILKAQEGLCAICGSSKGGRKYYIDGLEEPLLVDHNHTTGLVRGLLCHSCNAGLGFFKDNSVLLTKAIEYLEKTPSE